VSNPVKLNTATTEYLDHYCERVLPTLWDEPLNVISNLAFLIAAYLIIKQLSKPARQHLPWDLWLLILLIPVIGAGSTLWHILAVQWTLWADRIPIIFFISVFLLSSLIRALRVAPVNALMLFLLFHMLNTLVQLTVAPDTFNGSLFYVPAALFLTGMTAILWLQHNASCKVYFFHATLVFYMAIALRTLDLTLCDSVRTGTHFIWHILIGLSIYLLMIGLLKSAGVKLTISSKDLEK